MEWLHFGSMLGRNKQLLGLDIGSSAIKVVQMKEVNGKYFLQRFGMKPLEPEVIVDGTVMDAGRVVVAIKELLNETNIKLKNVAISVSGHSVIVKKISLPSMGDDELESEVKVAAEQYIPFDINEVNLDFHVVRPSEPSDEGQAHMSLLLVAAKKDKVNEMAELVRGAGLIPTVLDIDAFAIENMYGVNYESDHGDVVGLVNIGASVMNINILKDGSSLFTRDIAVGGSGYSEAIQRELGVTFEEAESIKKSHRATDSNAAAVAAVLDGVNAEVSSEIAKSIDYFKTTVAGGDLKKLMLSGGCAKVSGLADQLSERMGLPVEPVNPFLNIDVSGAGIDEASLSDLAPMAAVGVGLAVRTIGDR